MQAVCPCGCGEVVQHGDCVFEQAANENSAVCEPEVGKVRVTVVFGRSDSMVDSVPLF